MNNEKIRKEARICNICSLPEPTRHSPEDEADECLGHIGIHPSLWNLAENNTLWNLQSRTPLYSVTFKQYQRFEIKQYERSQVGKARDDSKRHQEEEDKKVRALNEAQLPRVMELNRQAAELRRSKSKDFRRHKPTADFGSGGSNE